MNRFLFFRRVVFLSVIAMLSAGSFLFSQPYIPVQAELLGPGYNLITRAGSDTAGHFFFAGNYSGTLSFRGKSLRAVGKQNVFLGRISASGQLESLRSLGGSGYCELQAACFLPDGSGRLLVFYRDTLRSGDSILVATGSGNLAVIRTNSAGEVQEVKNIVRGFWGQVDQMVSDENGVLWLGGMFRKASIGGKVYRSKGKSDALLISLEPEGKPVIHTLGGLGKEEIHLLQFHDSGLYLAGAFDHTLTTEDTLLVAGRRKVLFLARYDTVENKLKHLRVLARARDLSVTSAVWPEGGSLFLSGWFRSTLTLNDTSVVSTGNTDGFLLKGGKADSSLRIFTLGGAADDRIVSLAADNRGRLFMTATFKKQLILGSDTLTTGDRFPDVVFARFDTSLMISWTRHISGSGEENNTFLSMTKDQSAWIGGHTFGNLYLPDSENGTERFVNKGSYLLKYIDPCSFLQFDLPSEKIICRGVTDTLDAGSGYIHYHWWPGNVTDRKRAVRDTGFYRVEIMDHYGCKALDSIHVVADSVSMTFHVREETLPEGNNGSIEMTLLSGLSPFQVVWNTGETTEELTQLQAGTYSVRVTDSLGCTAESKVEVLQHDLTAVYNLYNYPNPFNDLTRFVYSLPEGTDVEIAIYDLTGKKLFVLTEQSSRKGIHSFEWSRKNLKDGVYYVRMQSRFGQISRKIIILKNH